MNNQHAVYAINQGDAVTGTYFGVPFTGTVASRRFHTINHRVVMFFVDLAAPITVLGLERDSIVVHGSHDQAALRHYLGHGDVDVIQAVSR